MTNKNEENLQQALNFVKAVEDGIYGDDLCDFYHPEIRQTEYPNALTGCLVIREHEALKAASMKGKQVLSAQTYAVLKSHVAGNAVILEVFWTGTLAIPIGKLKPGEKMEAYFAQFFEFKDGLIYRQRNYDCFIPFDK